MVCLWPLIAFLCAVDKLLPSAIYISLFVMKKPCGESLFSDLNLVSSLSSSSWLSSELNFSWNFVDPIFLHSGNNRNFVIFFCFFYRNSSVWVVLICWCFFGF